MSELTSWADGSAGDYGLGFKSRASGFLRVACARCCRKSCPIRQRTPQLKTAWQDCTSGI